MDRYFSKPNEQDVMRMELELEELKDALKMIRQRETVLVNEVKWLEKRISASTNFFSLFTNNIERLRT